MWLPLLDYLPAADSPQQKETYTHRKETYTQDNEPYPPYPPSEAHAHARARALAAATRAKVVALARATGSRYFPCFFSFPSFSPLFFFGALAA